MELAEDRSQTLSFLPVKEDGALEALPPHPLDNVKTHSVLFSECWDAAGASLRSVWDHADATMEEWPKRSQNIVQCLRYTSASTVE